MLTGTVYLIRLEEKLANRSQYYIGFTTRHPKDRLEDHRTGRGSKMLAAAIEAGISFTIVRIWENVDRNFERSLKNQRNHKRFCPVVNKSLKQFRYKS